MRWCIVFLLLHGVLEAQAPVAPSVPGLNVAGRVIDERGSAVAGARVEVIGPDAVPVAVTSSDAAGNFKLMLNASGKYDLRVERQGFYLYQGKGQQFDETVGQLTITLNHLQEFSDRIDVEASPAAIDPQQPSDHKELDNTEIENVPYPASRDYRNALPMMDGVVQDNSGLAHFNGGNTYQTNYTLDGFNISNPVTGNLDARINIDSIQSMDLTSSRYSAENGSGSAGVLDLNTKMGDDRFRFGATNFFPGFSTQDGFHISKFSPQLEFSGPIVKGRVWFHEGFDNFYNDDVVAGLPNGQNRTNGLSSSSLSRFQINLTPANILTASLLVNRQTVDNSGLSFLNPVETTTDQWQMVYMSTLHDQAYLRGGFLLDLGFADTRGTLRTNPQGEALYEITPWGSLGNYFVATDEHFYRQQGRANLFLPVLHLWGTHQVKVGADFEREAFHELVERHDYEVLSGDNSVSRFVQFVGAPFEGANNFAAAEYIQDHWTPHEGVAIEAGMRLDWNEIVREFDPAPRFSVAWAPGFLHSTKFSVGWGIYYDAISLQWLAPQPDQASLSTFFPDGVSPLGPVLTYFTVDPHALETPYYQSASFNVERKLPFGFYGKAGYIHRTGSHGFAFQPASPAEALAETGRVAYQLTNSLNDRYDAVEVSIRRTFAGGFEWFAGYTRSSARSNAAVDYTLENPIFALQAPGPYAWDAPNRFHMWGWAPLPNRILPRALRFITRNTSAVYLLEYRTGFPFNVVDQNDFLVGSPNSARLPAYFNINLDFERKFRALHYQWAWRFGFTNITNNPNPNYVNNVIGTPQFLTYARGQTRAFNVRLKFLGRH